MLYITVHAILLFSMSFMLGSCVPQLVIFLSNQGLLGSHGLRHPMLRSKSLKDWTDYEQQYVLTRLLQDLLLVCLFMLQHSLMASDRWKRLLLRCNVYVSERLLYVLASCFTLSVMIGRWVSMPDVLLWGVDTDNHALLWLFFFLLHAAAWLVLFLQVAVMDPLELIGIKQVYHFYKGRSSPLSYLPKQLRIFYQHLRHTGPSSLCLMLWVHPVMTLDRLLLALLFTSYLALAHQVSLADYKFARSYFVLQETTTTTTTTKHRVYKD